MSKTRIVLIVIGLLVLASMILGAVQPAFGAEPAGYQNVTVWVNPEYDDPRLLVMVQGQVTGVTPPATVRFLVPAGAEMYSAGSMDAQGKYTGGPPDRKASEVSGYDEISYTLTTTTFRVEYYIDSIKGLPDKAFDFESRWLYPVNGLTIMVQEPLRSSNFTVDPPGGTSSVDGEGFKVLRYRYEKVEPGQPSSFNVSYTKADSKPSLGGGSTSTAPASGGGGTLSFPTVPIAIALGAVVVVALMLVANRRSGFRRSGASRAQARAAARASAKANARAGRSTTKAAARTGAAATGARYCHDCGQPLSGNGRFCANCGAQQ